MKKYDEMINELVEIEMDEASHSDYLEDYNSKLEFYLSNAERDSYIDYIKSNYNVTTEEASKIQAQVIAEIKRRYEAIQLAASMAGKKGGKSKSAAKVKASAENGKKGGRPRKSEQQKYSGHEPRKGRIIMKVFDTAEIGGKKLAILVNDESMRAYEAVEIDGEWEIDFAYPCIGIDADDAAQNLDFEGAREAGYRFPED